MLWLKKNSFILFSHCHSNLPNSKKYEYDVRRKDFNVTSKYKIRNKIKQ